MENIVKNVLSKKLLAFIETRYSPIKLDYLLSLKEFAKKQHLVHEALHELCQKKLVTYTKNLGIIEKPYLSFLPDLSKEPILCRIKFTMNGDGIAIVEQDKTHPAIFIHKSQLKNALHMCLAYVQITKRPFNEKKAYFEGIVEKVVEYEKEQVVFEVRKTKKETKYICFEKKYYYDVVVINEANFTFNDEDYYLALINKVENNIIYLFATKKIANKNESNAIILALANENNVPIEFSKEGLSDLIKIREFYEKEKSIEYSRRIDLRHLNFITIDPFESKDMDDSICVIRNNNELKLYVAIADVTYFLKPNSNLFFEAIKRGTSVYLLSDVIPMLPFDLADDLCSLNPNEDKYVMVNEITFNSNYQIIHQEVYEGIINSKKKFSYDEVNEFFDTGIKKEEVNPILYEMLYLAKDLANYLISKRINNGLVEFDIKEPKIVLDESKKVVKEVGIKKTGFAQKMIEHFMISANESVAYLFHKKLNNHSFIYRSHLAPIDSKIQQFNLEAKKLFLNVNSSSLFKSSKLVNDWLNSKKASPLFNVINLLLLRTMNKANYETQLEYHFGLGLKFYTHFTSPIRRIADTLVHLFLKVFYLENDGYSDALKANLKENIQSYLDSANQTEIRAINTERAVNSYYFCLFMIQNKNKEFDAMINSITKNGIYVELKNMISGSINLKANKDFFFVFDPLSAVLFEKNTQTELQLGTLVKVKPYYVDLDSRQITFEVTKIKHQSSN